jgi:hypothetical protein
MSWPLGSANPTKSSVCLPPFHSSSQHANRTPVDSNFLHAVHSFKMDLIPALERTLQGKVKPRTQHPPARKHNLTINRTKLSN